MLLRRRRARDVLQCCQVLVRIASEAVHDGDVKERVSLDEPRQRHRAARMFVAREAVLLVEQRLRRNEHDAQLERAVPEGLREWQDRVFSGAAMMVGSRW